MKNKTSKYNYLEILENNPYKRERWSFFIRYDSDVTPELLFRLKNCLKRTEFFTLARTKLSRNDVNFLLNRNKAEFNSYMNRYQLKKKQIVTRSTLLKFLKCVNKDRIDEAWNFGNITFKFRNVNNFSRNHIDELLRLHLGL